MSELLKGLNPAQQQAVVHGEGPLLVLAGPGSGKTRVITHRIAYLIREHGVAPENLLAVTFTNKAAEEMRRRLMDLVPGVRLLAATFHSFCARLLRRYADRVGLTRHFSILDQNDRSRLLGSVLKDLKIDGSHLPIDAVERRISQLKNQLVGPEECAERASDYFELEVAKIYPVYEQRLADANAVDFDGLLVLVANLLRCDAELRARLDAQYRFVLVDEYQDTNLAQYAIARGLSIDHPHLCVTGDPDQSIYSWRGANLNNILSFESDFPGAQVVRLEQNYRSSQQILAAADSLIRHNTQRKHKELRTENPPGVPVTVYCHRDESAEASTIAERIRLAVDEGERRYRDFAVFVRVSSLTRAVEAAFRGRLIPYQVIGGYSFFERKEIRDVLAYVRLALNPRDNPAFERIVNTPARGIGQTTLERLRGFAMSRGLPLAEACRHADTILGIRGKPAAALREFRGLLDRLSEVGQLGPAEALRTVLEQTRYLESLEDSAVWDDEDRGGNLADFLASAQEYALANPDATLVDFLETISLSSDVDRHDPEADRVTLMTLHAAKGLEFPVVFMVAFEQGLLPHERSVRSGNEEEERRLAFVGMTRAKEELTLSYVQRRLFQGRYLPAAPSPFLLELPLDALRREDLVTQWSSDGYANEPHEVSQETLYEEPSIQVLRGSAEPSSSDRFRKGMLVSHPTYGQGQILQLEGVGDSRKATIHFPSAGTRRFVLSKSPLQPVT